MLDLKTYINQFIDAVKADRGLTDDDLAKPNPAEPGKTLRDSIEGGVSLLVGELLDHLSSRLLSRHAYTNAGEVVIILGSWTPVLLGTKVFDEDDNSHAASTAEVEVEHTGRYFVGYHVNIEARANGGFCEARIEVDTGEGFAALERSNTHDSSDAAIVTLNASSIPVDLKAGHKLRIAARETSGALADTIDGQCSLSFIRIG